MEVGVKNNEIICCASRFCLRVMVSQGGLEEIIQGDEEGGKTNHS